MANLAPRYRGAFTVAGNAEGVINGIKINIQDYILYNGQTTDIWQKGYIYRWTAEGWEQVPRPTEVGDPTAYLYYQIVSDITDNAPEAIFSTGFINTLITNKGFIKTLTSDKAFIKNLAAEIFSAQDISLKKGGIIQSESFVEGKQGFRLKSNGDLETNNAVVRGKVYAEDGEFKGKVIATSGEFSGKVNATSGSFNGTVNAVNGFFSDINLRGLLSFEEGAKWVIDNKQKTSIYGEMKASELAQRLTNYYTTNLDDNFLCKASGIIRSQPTQQGDTFFGTFIVTGFINGNQNTGWGARGYFTDKGDGFPNKYTMPLNNFINNGDKKIDVSVTLV